MDRVDGWNRRYLTFQGRLSRIAFWRTWLAVQVFGALVLVLGLFVSAATGKAGALILVPGLALFAIAFASCLVRRLHDRGKTGWWLVPYFGGPLLAQGLARSAGAGAGLLVLLLALAAFGVNIWMLVEIGFRRGAPAANEFGAPA
jgi:uncharacterized membrane protein YhaH (DUF805 family)